MGMLSQSSRKCACVIRAKRGGRLSLDVLYSFAALHHLVVWYVLKGGKPDSNSVEDGTGGDYTQKEKRQLSLSKFYQSFGCCIRKKEWKSLKTKYMPLR